MPDSRHLQPSQSALIEHIDCPSCLTVNAAQNTYCEACGWNLRTAILGRRATPWWVAIAIGVFVLIAYFFLRSPGDAPEVSPSPSAVASTVNTSAAVLQELTSTSVQAATPKHERGAENLLDGDATTVWYVTFSTNDPPTLTFTFGNGVEVGAISIRNLTEGEAFERHARVASIQVVTGSSTSQTVDFLDTPDRQRVDIAPVSGRLITVEIRSIHSRQTSADAPPLDEIALVELTFYGTNP